MIFPAEMERVEIAFLSEDRDNVLESLQKEGVMEINEAENRKLIRDVDVETGHISSLHVRSEKIVRDVNIPKSFLDSILGIGSEGGMSIDKKRMKDTFENAEKTIDFFETNINVFNEGIKSNEKEFSEISSQLETMKYVEGVDVDFSDLNSLKNVFYFFGRTERGKEEYLKKSLNRFHVFRHYVTKNKNLIVFVMGINDIMEDIRKAMLSSGVEIFEMSGFHGKTGEIAKGLEERTTVLAEEKERLEKKKVDFIEQWLPELRKTNSILRIYKERMKSLSLLKQTNYVSFVSGFAPTKRKVNVMNAIDRATGGRLFIDFQKTKDGPTKLENPKLVKRFETLTKGFGLPKSNEIDPTFFMSIFFPVLFGIMLSDVFYGAIMICIAFGIRLYTKNEITMDFSRIIVLCGISAMTWGFLFGSFLGNFFGFSGLLLSPTGNPVNILLLALGVGIFHINLGFVLSMIQKIKSRKSVVQEISWFLIEIGGGLLILNLFNVVTGIVLYPSIAIMIFGILIKISVPSNTIEIMSFLGNVLSYVRLAAICLATAYIALTVNHITSIILPISFAFAAVFFVAGHIFNCTISSVGAFVNSLRLQYVEFFSSFFSGDGRMFRPLKLDRGIKLMD